MSVFEGANGILVRACKNAEEFAIRSWEPQQRRRGREQPFVMSGGQQQQQQQQQPHMSSEVEHKSPRESGEDSEDESEILEESPCGRWLKRREEVSQCSKG